MYEMVIFLSVNGISYEQMGPIPLIRWSFHDTSEIFSFSEKLALKLLFSWMTQCMFHLEIRKVSKQPDKVRFNPTALRMAEPP